VRFGVMIVGSAMVGKSTCINILKSAYIELNEQLKAANQNGVNKHPDFQNILSTVLNPKSISLEELYGLFDPLTQSWTDGLASTIIRNFVNIETLEKKWVIFDGPVDALWIENMNSVLDDSMTLCLSNGERIKLKPQLRMLFEVQDLSGASPATVSRCGMVYLDQEVVGYASLVLSYFKKNLNFYLPNMEAAARLAQHLVTAMGKLLIQMKKM